MRQTYPGDNQDFYPTPGSFCGLCGITAHCPAMAQALMPVDILAPATRKMPKRLLPCF